MLLFFDFYFILLQDNINNRNTAILTLNSNRYSVVSEEGVYLLLDLDK